MLEKLITIVAEQLNVEEAEIKLESDFKNDLHADSLDLFELIMALEEEYGITIEMEELQGFVTVQNIVDFITEKTA